MDTNDLIQMISSVGFPICACIALFKMYTKTTEEFRKTLEENTKMIEAVKTAIATLIADLRIRNGDDK